MTTQRILSLLLSGILASSAAADDLGRIRVRRETIDGVTWNYVMRGSTAALGAPGASAVASDTAGRVVVPAEINGFTVGGYATPLFRDCENLEEVDFTNVRSSFMQGTFFRNCPSLRRVVFPRRPYYIGGTGDDSPFFENCPALEELVFPGSVPHQLQNLGVSTDGKLRVGREFERAWQVFAEDHGVSGMQVLDDPAGAGQESPRGPGYPAAARPSLPDPAVALAYAARDPACKPLETLASQMIAAIGKKKKEMQDKEETLRTSLRGALERAKAAAQSKGDLDGVLLFEEAAKNPDATSRSDNEALREIYKTRDEAKAGYRTAFDQDCARILATAVTQLDKMKSEETKKGNIALAKEVAEYQKSVQDVLDRIQKALGKGAAPSGRPAQAANPGAAAPGSPAAANAGPPSIGGTSRSVTVPVDKANGTGLGRFEQGEILVVQYLSGTYMPYRGSSRAVNPDEERDFYYSSEGRVALEGPINSPNRRVRALPKGTAKRPFAIVIPESGHYNLKCYAGNYSEGRISFRITKLDVLAAKEFGKTGNKSAFQWP